jgi:hypothetical protein
MKKWLVLLLSITAVSTKAQNRSTTHYERVWMGAFNQTRLSNKWGLWVDAHLRTQDGWVNGFSQAFVRLGLTYYITDVTKVAAGYAFVHEFPGVGHKNIATYEHRPWQQIQWHTAYAKNRMMQWLRLEQRYRRKLKNDDELGVGYNFNWRLRYNIWYEIPFHKSGLVPKSWSVILNDELHVNFGKAIVYNVFDQNRLFVGVKYQLTPHSNLQVGYMNWYQQMASGNQFRNSHVARIFYFHNVDLRSK